MKWLLFFILSIASLSYGNDLPTFIIGVSPENPPLSTRADNQDHFFGFEIDLMNEFCIRLKIKCDYKSVVVSMIAQELKSEKIDFSIAAIIRPLIPIEGFVFSLPYLSSGAKFMALKKSKINTPDEISGTTVGVRRGTLEGGDMFKELILLMYHNKIKVKEYITINDLIMALANQEIDSIFTNAIVIDFWYYNDTNAYKIIGTTIPIGDGYAVMATPRNTVYIEKMNQALQEMFSDGTYLKIYNLYFGAFSFTPHASFTQGWEYCQIEDIIHARKNPGMNY